MYRRHYHHCYYHHLCGAVDRRISHKISPTPPPACTVNTTTTYLGLHWSSNEWGCTANCALRTEDIVYGSGLRRYLIIFAPHTLVLDRRTCPWVDYDGVCLSGLRRYLVIFAPHTLVLDREDRPLQNAFAAADHKAIWFFSSKLSFGWGNWCGGHYQENKASTQRHSTSCTKFPAKARRYIFHIHQFCAPTSTFVSFVHILTSGPT